MKVAVSKDFGTNRRAILPLVPEPMTVLKKEDFAQVDLLSDPADPNSTKVKFSFKILKGGNGETARDVIQWFTNVERAFAGLNSTNRQLRQMVQQLAAGSAPSGFDHNAQVLAAPARAVLIATAQAAMTTDDGTNAARQNGLNAQLAAVQALTNETVLAQNGGLAIITTALNGMMTVLLPNKTLQRVKRHLRREARKPVDMPVREHLMHIIRIETQEIPCLVWFGESPPVWMGFLPKPFCPHHQGGDHLGMLSQMNIKTVKLSILVACPHTSNPVLNPPLPEGEADSLFASKLQRCSVIGQ